jgi:hypothetical protein
VAASVPAGDAVAAPNKSSRPTQPPAQSPARSPKPADKPEPSEKTDAADKLDAKSLMQSGLKLYAAKDFLGALAVFRTAYARFPSAKILLNIGTTLTRLDRKAEAANIYQHYLDSPDADPAKQTEVRKVLAELDASVAILELTITPAAAELQIGDDEWIAAAGEPRHRVPPGPITVRVRQSGYVPGEETATATAGARLPIAIALAEVPPPLVVPAPAVPVDTGVRATATGPSARSPIGVIALAHIDVVNRGGAGLVGVTADLTDRLQAQAAAILGPSYGGYAGASFAVLGGKVRPTIAAGMPIFASHGARFGVRGAGGVELAVNRHLAVIAELGVEYLFNPEADVKHTSFIPAIGAAGRL